MNTRYSLILALFILLAGFHSKAQTVTIPDPNFVAFLEANYSSCITGDQLDTQCAEVLAEDSLDVSYLAISDLTGIESFVSLTMLDCQVNDINFLPPLPAGLTTLNCSNNNLTSLPALPSGLTMLGCGYNNLTVLPALPSGLELLDCPDNSLNSLPALPAALTQLVFFSNNITVIPTLPSVLLTLICHTNQLSSLPSPLPAGLVNLGCSYNFLTEIPPLPGSLESLECAGNQLTLLPVLPMNIALLDCRENSLQFLPPLPNGLQFFYCDDNPDLTCLPILPEQLVTTSFLSTGILEIVGTQITCTPNIPPLISFNTLPLCLDGDFLNNPNGCDNNALISGLVYTDTSANCQFESSESAGAGIKLFLIDDSNDTSGIAYTTASGAFDFFYCDFGNYTLVIDTLNKPYDVQCPNPGSDTSFSFVMDSLIHVEFALDCPTGLDFGVSSVFTAGVVFPGQPYTLRVFAGDLVSLYLSGCPQANMAGTVEITVTGNTTYLGTSLYAITPASVSGNTFTYTIADFSTVDTDSAFSLMFETPTTAMAGDSICVSVVLNTGVTDLFPLNNEAHFCYQVLNSYDPNIKEVYPTLVEPGYDDWLTYTIHFQNTGNAPAFNIKLKDTLSPLVNPNSFELLAYSHTVGVELNDHNATFRFDNIMLPDSASDPEGSIGFIQYRVKPLSNLPDGTEINNKAYIFFDYNAPIITNTAITSFEVDYTGITAAENSRLELYPNPGTGLFFVKAPDDFSGDDNVLNVYNLAGELVRKIQPEQAGTVTLDLSAEKAGVYFVHWMNGSEIFSAKVIKY